MHTFVQQLKEKLDITTFIKLNINCIIVWKICCRSDLENFNFFLTVASWLSIRLCMQVKMGFSCLIISFQHWELNILQTNLCYALCSLTWRWCINHQLETTHPLQEKPINTRRKYFSLWIANISIWLQSISMHKLSLTFTI